MENFVVEFCPTRSFFDSNEHDLLKLEKPDLILRIIELTKENEDLKRKLKEIEDTSYTSDKERLSSLGQELEALKIKLNEKSQSISASTLETIKMHEHSPPSSVSINSKDEEREQEEKAKTLPEIEKNASPPNRNSEDGINKNSSTKSPSMVLMEQDAEYYKKFMTTRPARNSVESRVWTKEILVSIRNKEPREKILGQIQHSIQDFIPKKYRGEVWPILIGNPLRMKRAIYDQLCKSMESFPVNDKVKSQIKEDLVRTYPELKSFSRGNALNEDLQYLLELFHFARPDIGYVQGISYPASILLLYMDSYHAFKCLMNLIVCRPFLTNLYRFKLDEIRLVCKAFDHLLKQRSPLVQKHLERMNISPEVYLIEWLVTLFCRNFHIDDTANIWDMFLLEGEVALVKVALKIFQMIEPELIRKDYAETLYYLRSCTDEIDMERLFKNVQSSQLTQEKFRKLVEKEKNKKKEGIKNIFGALFVKPIM